DKELLENISIRRSHAGEPIPYHLLLNADPSPQLIVKYLETAELHIAFLNGEVIASLVLDSSGKDILEIKNIAVDERYQGRGIGQKLPAYAEAIAKGKNVSNMLIGTGNSSIGQLYLYQKSGFEITEIKKNFFHENYYEPIFEHGIPCRHMIVLR